jgi:hypothetical protein
MQPPWNPHENPPCADDITEAPLHEALEDFEVEDFEEGAARGAVKANGRKWRNVAERWVPYKQTNGVAIYRLDEKAMVDASGGAAADKGERGAVGRCA